MYSHRDASWTKRLGGSENVDKAFLFSDHTDQLYYSAFTSPLYYTGKNWIKPDMPYSGHDKFIEISYIYNIGINILYYSIFMKWTSNRSAIFFLSQLSDFTYMTFKSCKLSCNAKIQQISNLKIKVWKNIIQNKAWVSDGTYDIISAVIVRFDI